MKRINKLTIFTYIMFLLYLSLIILNDIRIININIFIKPILLIFTCLIIKIFSKKEYLRNKDNKENVKRVIFNLGLALLIFFLLGLAFGYSYNVYSYDINTVIKNIFCFSLIYVFIEYIRFYLASHSMNNKIIYVIITILFILSDINYSSLINSLSSNKEIFIYLFTDLFPIITKNIVVMLLFINYGLYSALTYQIIYSLFILFIPILPSINYFLKFILLTLIPLFVYIRMKDEEKNLIEKNDKKSNAFTVTFISIIIFILCFNFGLFKYSPIAVASNSMEPEFQRGSLVMYKKLDANEIKELKEKDIIVFNYNNDIYIHRIIKVSKNDDKYLYTTKGDANSFNDKEKTKEDNVVGKVIFDIPYIGYPSVWIENILN